MNPQLLNILKTNNKIFFISGKKSFYESGAFKIFKKNIKNNIYFKKNKYPDFVELKKIIKIVENFKDCIEYDKRNNHKCRLSRVHYIDTRFKYNSPTISEYEITTHFVIVCKSIINTEK